MPLSTLRSSSADTFAEECLKSNNITENAVRETLRLLGVPATKGRERVKPKGWPQVRSCLFGLYARANTVGITQKTRTHPHVAELLAAYGQKKRPSFPFTSITVNVNWAARPHTDAANLGASLVTALGKFKGGELFHEDAAGDKQVRLTENVGAHYKKGSCVRGFESQVKGRWLEFDGNKLHYVKRFQGDRASLVFFTTSRYGEAKPDVRMELGETGFHFTWSNPRLADFATKSCDRQEAPAAPAAAPAAPAAAPVEASSDVQQSEAEKKACKAIMDLLNVNSNQKGGGGTQLYRDKMANLRRKLQALPAETSNRIEILLAEADGNFEGKTNATWRRFLPPALGFLRASKEDIAKAKPKASPTPYAPIGPVQSAVARAKKLKLSESNPSKRRRIA